MNQHDAGQRPGKIQPCQIRLHPAGCDQAYGIATVQALDEGGAVEQAMSLAGAARYQRRHHARGQTTMIVLGEKRDDALMRVVSCGSDEIPCGCCGSFPAAKPCMRRFAGDFGKRHIPCWSAGPGVGLRRRRGRHLPVFGRARAIKVKKAVRDFRPVGEQETQTEIAHRNIAPILGRPDAAGAGLRHRRRPFPASPRRS